MRKNVKGIMKLSVITAVLFAMVLMAIPASADDFRNPIEAVYESYGEMGYARGSLTVKVDAWVNTDGCPMEAVVYWANVNGALEGYSPLARFMLSTRSTTFEFPELQIIPKEADRLRVYTARKGDDTLSSVYVDAMLPEGYGYNLEDTPIMSFVVVSDTHLRVSDDALANQRFTDMLEDVNKDFSNVSGIFINGDNINASGMGGSDTQTSANQFAKLEEYRDLYPDIPIFMGIGNHDLWPNGKQDEALQMFLQIARLPDGSHPTSLNYDFYLDGYHFVFVGDDDRDPNYATLNNQTLKWLDDTIKEGYEEDTPTFIFLHQALSNTVAGSLTNYGQAWDGVVNVVEVRNVLRKYPRAVLFSGHSHYSMDSVQNAFSGGSTFPTTFNTSSLSDVYLAGDEAQGYIVEVYEKAVLVRGRDFAADEWKASAQYAIDYGAELAPAPEIPANKDTDTPANDPNAGGNVNEENNGNSGNSGNANTNTDATNGATDGSDATDEIKPGGCGAAVSVSALAMVLLPATFCLVRKKKEDQ